MISYNTVTEAVQDLKRRGYCLALNVAFNKLICSANNNICLLPHEFKIVEVHRFEGESNPSDADVVYAVESDDGNYKGVVTSAYGVYADAVSNELLRKLEINTSDKSMP
jgi:hypothetical protein